MTTNYDGDKSPKTKKYHVKIDNEVFTVETPTMKGSEILLLAGKTPVECFDLFQQLHGQQGLIKIALDAAVDISDPGIEKFKTEKRTKVITINNQQKTVCAESMTGREILALINLTPEKYDLFLKGAVDRKILPDEALTIVDGMIFIAILREIIFG